MKALALASLAAALAAGEAPARGADLLRSVEVAALAGALRPAADLSGVLDPAPFLGVRLTTSYYGRWSAHAELRAAFLDGSRAVASVLLTQGGAGLEWSPPWAWLPAPGAGLGLYHLRLRERKGGEGYLFLSDGETEFGAYPFLRWSLALGESWSAHAGLRWDVIFSRPEAGQLASLHAGAGWRWR